MKTAFDKVGRGKARLVNARFQAMVRHFLFEPEFWYPAAGWEKGQIEKHVHDARPPIRHDVPRFVDLAALNAWLEHRCIALRKDIRHAQQPDRTIAAVSADERAHLMPMPPAFDGLTEDAKRVSPTCPMAFERSR